MIVIVRHGQTDANSGHRLLGRGNPPLNDAGAAQAAQAAKGLLARGFAFRHVFSSPLVRALRTALIIAPDVPPVTDARLIEMDMGPYEGADLHDLPPEVRVFFSDFANNPAPAGMEQLSDVVRRTGAFLEEIAPLEGDVLVCTHAIAMKAMLEYLTPGANGRFWSAYLGNCAAWAVRSEGGALGLPEDLAL
ncbi:MAG: histidine phosphatase family protein [Clostridiales bacterium]|nr:histidine phosphatase family protein [Clostridiales bacterium]